VKIAITGACGFIGEALARRLLAEGGLGQGFPALERLTLVDAAPPLAVIGERVRWLRGDFGEAAIQHELFGDGVDLVFHLAAMPGGAAEADAAAGWRVNLAAPMSLFEAFAQSPHGTKRVVFASSVAVFGAGVPPHVDDETYPAPTLSYGAQKLMVETWLADVSRRGVLDARSVRLPGIVARPETASGHISAFLSNIFHKLARRESFVAPMGPAATTWLLSRETCVDNLLIAARAPQDRLPGRRAWTMPALRLSMQELVEALAAALGPQVLGLVAFTPDARIEAQFGRQPPLATAVAEGLGMRHDGDAAGLVVNVLRSLREIHKGDPS